MCVTWTDSQWKQNSQPADPTSRFKLQDTRYNQDGANANTYRESDGWWYGVLPGYGVDAMFAPGDNAQASALAYLAENGYTLTEPPVLEGKPATTAELIAEDVLTPRDLVENFS